MHFVLSTNLKVLQNHHIDIHQLNKHSHSMNSKCGLKKSAKEKKTIAIMPIFLAGFMGKNLHEIYLKQLCKYRRMLCQKLNSTLD